MDNIHVRAATEYIYIYIHMGCKIKTSLTIQSAKTLN